MYYLFILNKFIYLFIFGCIGSLLLCMGFSLVAVSRGYSSLQCTGFSLQWLLLLRSMGSRHTGFSSCGTWAQQLWLVGSRAQAQYLRRMGLAASLHVGSSWTRARTHVPCIGRWILNHCATREVPYVLFKIFLGIQFNQLLTGGRGSAEFWQAHMHLHQSPLLFSSGHITVLLGGW